MTSRSESLERARDLERILFIPLPPEPSHAELTRDSLKQALFRLVTNCPASVNPFSFFDEGRARAWSHYGRQPANIEPVQLHADIDAAVSISGQSGNVLRTLEVMNVLRYLSKRAELPNVAPLSDLKNAIEQFAGNLTGNLVVPECLMNNSRVTAASLHRLLDDSIAAASTRFPLSQGSVANLAFILEEFYCAVVRAL